MSVGRTEDREREEGGMGKGVGSDGVFIEERGVAP